MTHEEKVEIRATVKRGIWGLFITVVVTAFTLGAMLQDIRHGIKQNAVNHKEYQQKTDVRLERIENHLWYKGR